MKCPNCGTPVSQFAAGCAICGEDLVAARERRDRRRQAFSVPASGRLPRINGQDALIAGLRELGESIVVGGKRDVMRLVLGQGLVVALAGIGLGLAGATALTRVVSTFLVGVSATDPITFAGVPALLLALAIVASLVPARRASRVDPVEALRAR